MIVNFHNIELETSEDAFRPTLISEECALNADFMNKKVLDMGCGIGPLAIYFAKNGAAEVDACDICLLYTSPSPRDRPLSRMPSSA